MRAEDLIPRDQGSFPLHQLAKIFNCTVAHLFNLICEDEIVVPKEEIDRKPSRGMIVVTRDNIVDFVRRRSSVEWFAARASDKAEARAKQNAKDGVMPTSRPDHPKQHSTKILCCPTNLPSASWTERRQSLLHAACTAIAALRENGTRIGRAITLVARKFRKRSLGGGRRLRLSSKSLRAHWVAWNAAGREESIFRSRYKPGVPKAELDRSLLPSIVETCFRNSHTLAQVLLTFQPTALLGGRPVSKSSIYRRLPAREIGKLVLSQRRLTRLARDLEQRQTALLNTVTGEKLR